MSVCILVLYAHRPPKVLPALLFQLRGVTEPSVQLPNTLATHPFLPFKLMTGCLQGIIQMLDDTLALHHAKHWLGKLPWGVP